MGLKPNHRPNHRRSPSPLALAATSSTTDDTYACLFTFVLVLLASARVFKFFVCCIFACIYKCVINLYSFFFTHFLHRCAFLFITFFVILVVKRPCDMSASRAPGPGPKSRDPDSLHVVLGSARPRGSCTVARSGGLVQPVSHGESKRDTQPLGLSKK